MKSFKNGCTIFTILSQENLHQRFGRFRDVKVNRVDDEDVSKVIREYKMAHRQKIFEIERRFEADEFRVREKYQQMNDIIFKSPSRAGKRRGSD
jgi:hypothetical protein